MADISYSRTFQHVDWIDNEDVIQAGGKKGFNQKFHDLEEELDKISAVVGAISERIGFQQVNTGRVTVPENEPVEQIVAQNVPNTKPLAYFPLLTIAGTTGSGHVKDIEGTIVYRQSHTTVGVDVVLRLVNSAGHSEAADVIWAVNRLG
jgi:hypothetical protein